MNTTTKNTHHKANAKPKAKANAHAKPKANAHAKPNKANANAKPNKAKSGLRSLPEKTLKQIVKRLDKLLKTMLPKKMQK